MKKQKHDKLIELLSEYIPQEKNEHFERQRQTDNVIVWLTALSTGAIALILSQSDKLNIGNPIYLKVSVALLLLSIVSGVVYRSTYYPLEALWSKKYNYFKGFCLGFQMETFGPTELTENDTIETIAMKLKEDMGLDYDHWLKHDYLDRDFWVEHYYSWAKFWEKSEEDGLMELSRAIAILNNKDPKVAKNVLEGFPDEEEATRKKFSFLSSTCNIAYQSALLFFVLSICSLAVGYINS